MVRICIEHKSAVTTILFVLALGCTCNRMPQDATSRKDIVKISSNGSVYVFPYELHYDHKTWIRSESGPSPYSSGVICNYHSMGGRLLIQFFQGAPDEAVKWTFHLYESQEKSTNLDEAIKVLIVGNRGDGTETICRGGYLIGPIRLFYANGALKGEGVTYLAQRHGAFSAYYPNGQLWWSGRYDRGNFQVDGAKFYDRNGNEVVELSPSDMRDQVKAWNATEVSNIELTPKEFASLIDTA